MESPFDIQIKRFVDAGNTVVGRPAKVSGKVLIQEYKTGSTIVFGKDCQIANSILRFPQGGGTLHIGNNAEVRLTAKIASGSRIEIGDGTAINRISNFLAWEGRSIFIGANCLLSNTRIRTSDMHPMYDGYTGERINHAKDVFIESGVWIGEDVLINKGAHIGTGSVIGAGALVTKNIPPNSVAVGRPAAVVRKNVVWERSYKSVPKKLVLETTDNLSWFQRLAANFIKKHT
jgi:acetyltransferase-like isoleucine patch superfamily enzyme